MKIKNFQVKIKEREVLSQLKEILNEEQKGDVIKKIEEIKNLIKPAVIIETYTNENLEKFKDISDDTTTAVTVFVGTIGKEIEEEILLAKDEVEKRILSAIATEYCNEIGSFVNRIINEEAKKDGYFILEKESIPKEKFQFLLSDLKAESIGVILNGDVLEPIFSCAGFFRWEKKRRR